jgi:hypothetical protein
MSLDSIATINITSAGAAITAPGFGTPLICSHSADWAERVRTYANLSAVVEDFAATTPEYAAASSFFAQEPSVEQVKIGRCALVPTQRFNVSVQSVGVDSIYTVSIAFENGTAQEAEYTAVGAATWVALTAYAVGYLLTNDTGKGYVCITAGTSAAATGPTGTAADITDGTVHWMYVGAIAEDVASNDAILHNLLVLIDAFADPALSITTSLQGSAGSKTLRILADTAGDFYDVAITDRALLRLAQDHSDPGIATDLAAILLEDADWYMLHTLFNSYGVVTEAADWVESNGPRIYIAGTCDTIVPQATYDSGTSTDAASKVKAQAYDLTHVFFHPLPGEFADAALAGTRLPTDPGSETWKFGQLSGVTTQGYTGTHQTRMETKYAGYYQTLGSVGSVSGDAKMGSGRFIDRVRFEHWYAITAQLALVNLANQRAPRKLPMTEQGLGLIKTALEAVNKQGVRFGGIASFPVPQVLMPLAADISSADREARIVRGIEVSFTFAEAVHSMIVNVVIS